MICPICGSFSKSKEKCSSCGNNIKMFGKMYDISDKLYNKGLYEAQSSNFTRAEDFLSKSVLFNKNNINARNLLGLVYYATGQVSLALKQWVISTNIQKENNIATEYMDYFQKNTNELNNYNESLKLYNQALKSAKQRGEDMAIIHLKKAVELNPNFTEALNLLSLCYVAENKVDNAIDTIKTVLSIDLANSKALKYFYELCPNGSRMVESIKIVKTNKVYDEPVKFEPKISKKVKESKFSKMMELIVFVAGCFCTAAVMLILVFPGISNEKQDEIDKINSEMLVLQNKYDEEKSKNDAANAEGLAKENETLKSELAKYQKQVEVQSSIDQITNAQKLVTENKYSEAAELITSVNINNISDNAEKLKEYEELKKKVYKKESKNLLNKGTSFVNSKKYQEAKETLEKCILYSDDDDNKATKYNAMYYLAKAEKELGDSAKAKEYYYQVAENHPQNRYKNLAKKEMDAIG